MPRHFIVRQGRGPRWDPERSRRRQEGWDEHAAYIDRLTEERKIRVGGPVGDVDGLHVVVIVVAETEDEARAMFDADPWMDGILRIESVEPWTIWTGSLD